MSLPLWPSWRTAVADVVLTLAVVSADVWLVSGLWHLDNPYGWAVMALDIVANATLVLRRRAPLVVAALLALAASVELASGMVAPGSLWPAEADQIWVVTALGTPFACYALVVYGTRPWLGWALIAFLTLVAVRPWHPYPAVVAIGLLSTAGPTVIGLYAAARRRLFSAMAERAERAEREQHLLAAQARADERARLAGEMHDVVTHRVSLMVLQAGALRVTAPDEPTRRAAEDLREAGCQALDELRDLLDVLRAGLAPDADAETRDGPVSLPDLSSLIAESASAGVPVELVETGDPLLISPVVGRTAHRIAQEALTNVRKHAPGASVRLHVAYDADRTRLTVRNTAPTGGPDVHLAASGSGVGLFGLRQRVELVGGTFDAGPLPGGGFHVDATLPAYVPPQSRPRSG